MHFCFSGSVIGCKFEAALVEGRSSWHRSKISLHTYARMTIEYLVLVAWSKYFTTTNSFEAEGGKVYLKVLYSDVASSELVHSVAHFDVCSLMCG